MRIVIIYLFVFCSNIVLAQSPITNLPTLIQTKKPELSVISGKVIDAKTGDAITGAKVLIDEEGISIKTDLDGKYTINVKPGEYWLEINYSNYKTVKQQIVVKVGDQLSLDFPLELKENTMVGVTVKGTKNSYKKETATALLLQQKNAPFVSDGISADLIRKSPDKNISDVMKRISGASVQDNKFIVIRGLNERYNAAFINNAPLPSSEVDRKAFSFDIFPSNTIDNMVVIKTASPELTGEFAGGIINITTKDIPEKKFMMLSYGSSYNNLTTFKQINLNKGGSLDWIGIDDGTRSIPKGIPSSQEFKTSKNSQKIEYAKLFENNWGSNIGKALPTSSFQFSLGKPFKIKGAKAGTLLSLTYQNSNRLSPSVRSDYDNEQIIGFNDIQYTYNTLAGAMWNSAIMFDENNRIYFKNILNINSTNQNIQRNGWDVSQGSNVLSYMNYFNQNIYLGSQLGGEHRIEKNKNRIKWNIGLGYVNRNVPDFMRLRYMQPIDDASIPFQAYIPSNAQPTDAGRFYSKLDEWIKNASFDYIKPIKLNTYKGEIKAGYYFQQREREFSARVLGYVSMANTRTELYYQNINDIFQESNMGMNGFALDENTNPNDQYHAASILNSAYVMLDQKVGKKMRIIGGVRGEYFVQKLASHNYSNEPINLNTSKLDILPSINLSYSLTDKSNLRFATSNTLSRPEFRELAPFGFFDFNLFLTLAGNPNLVRTKITNFDLRYEIFPKAGELFSASLFYKSFSNPIELVMDAAISGGTRSMSYRNADNAQVGGVELEFRKRLPLIFNQKWTQNLTFNTNVSIIYSRVYVGNIPGSIKDYRSLQGQSPYIINAGLSYQARKGLSFSTMFNRVGPKLVMVGTANYRDYYDVARTIWDIQVAYQMFKEKLEIKLNASDILAQSFQYIQGMPGSSETGYNSSRMILNTQMPRSISLTATYKF